jgi:environmental stress-induced protein Ves
VAADGPFSAYAGIDRQIVLLDGAGMELVAPAWRHRLDRAAAPFAFAGDDAVQASLLAGPVRDFNLMTRRGQWRADVEVARAAFSTPDTGTSLLFVLAGHWHLAGQPVLGPGEGWLADGASTFAPVHDHALCLRIFLRKEAANDC